MKKIKNYLFIFIIMVCSICFISRVDAAELALGNVDAGTSDNQKKVELKVIFAEGEEVADAKIKLACETVDSDVSCNFEKASNIVGSGDSNTYIFTSSTNFEAGSTVLLGYVVLTNNETGKKQNVSYTVKNKDSNITISDSITKTITLNGKASEMVYNTNPSISAIKFSVGNISPTFNTNTKEYTVTGIKDTINSITITDFTCVEAGCTIKDISGGKSSDKTSLKITLNQGENNVVIKFTAQDQDKEESYTFNIIRGETAFDSAKLSELSFGSYELNPAFNKNVTEYTLTVPNSVNSLINDIKYVAEDEGATVSTDGLDNFIVGENKLTITVDNVSGSETITYTVTVKRMSNTDIDITKYKDGKITFLDSEGVETTLDEDEFKLEYPDEWKKIEDEIYTFDEDGKIVLADKDATSTLETNDKSKKKNNTVLIIILVVLGLVIIVVSGILIFRKKKPKDNKKNNKKDTKENKDNEEEEIKEKEETKEDAPSVGENTMDIDEALSDLMSTKQYDFKEEDDN